MKNIFVLLNKFDIPGYDIDNFNELRLISVIKTANEHAIKFELNGQKYILFTADYLWCNRYSAESIKMEDKLEFIKPKGVDDDQLINADGEADYHVKFTLPIDFGDGSYSLARIVA